MEGKGASQKEGKEVLLKRGHKKKKEKKKKRKITRNKEIFQQAINMSKKKNMYECIMYLCMDVDM